MKQSFHFNILFLFIGLLMVSCQNKVDKKTLISYLNDPENGLKQEVKVGDYNISLTYRPTEMMMEQEYETDTNKAEEQKKEYEKYHYFILNMSLGDKDVLYKGSSSQQQFSASLNRLNFGLSEYVYALKDKKDTLYLADYYVPNLYGMGGSTQILLAFPNDKGKQYEELEINLKELGFGTGGQKFIFRKKDIEDVPSLKISLQNNIHDFKLMTHYYKV